MRRESSLGRTLWIALLVILCGYVVADFARTPFLASSGSAAVRPAQVTLWIPGTAGGQATRVAENGAAALTLDGHLAVVKQLLGGTSQAVGSFLSRPPRDGANLLVVTSDTLADLAHDRREQLVPGAAEQAAFAQAMLRRAPPLGLLASEPLSVAVPPASGIQTPDQLLAALRQPWSQLFAIADDTWSRSQLAALVSRAGVVGRARFQVFQSAGQAGEATARGAATTVLATRPALRPEPGERLHRVAWPFDGGRAPRAWVALVAPPGLPSSRLSQLRGWASRLVADRRSRQLLVEEGRRPGRSGASGLAALLRAGYAEANRLEVLARRVERG